MTRDAAMGSVLIGPRKTWQHRRTRSIQHHDRTSRTNAVAVS